ncbi:response regulator transcription factor [Clostridium sp.]|uniref:response regulator transcription factor n=1 Tax=Clostridium sp. TaxID=1506 RepID=UPI003F31076D
MTKGNILLVDDDKDIVNSIEIYLKNEGLNVYKAYDGIKALEVLVDNEIHLILMDIMMPKMDGLSATLKIREEKNIPIILVSAKTQDTDKIIGLNMGADDYITKPFNPLELVARVKSNLRRYVSLGNYKEESIDVLEYGALVLDNESKEVTVDGELVKLTPIEYKILEMLLKTRGRVFSSRQIYESVWEEPGYNCDRTVAVHIRRIREKIEINPKEPKYIKVVWGVGYKIDKK